MVVLECHFSPGVLYLLNHVSHVGRHRNRQHTLLHLTSLLVIIPLPQHGPMCDHVPCVPLEVSRELTEKTSDVGFEEIQQGDSGFSRVDYFPLVDHCGYDNVEYHLPILSINRAPLPLGLLGPSIPVVVHRLLGIMDIFSWKHGKDSVSTLRFSLTYCRGGHTQSCNLLSMSYSGQVNCH